MTQDISLQETTSNAVVDDPPPPPDAPVEGADAMAEETGVGDVTADDVSTDSAAVNPDGTPVNPLHPFHKSYWNGLPNYHCPHCMHKTTLGPSSIEEHLYDYHPVENMGG